MSPGQENVRHITPLRGGVGGKDPFFFFFLTVQLNCDYFLSTSVHRINVRARQRFPLNVKLSPPPLLLLYFSPYQSGISRMFLGLNVFFFFSFDLKKQNKSERNPHLYRGRNVSETFPSDVTCSSQPQNYFFFFPINHTSAADTAPPTGLSQNNIKLADHDQA